MSFLILILAIWFALIAWMRLAWAVLLICALLPSYLLRANFFGVPTTMLELMLLVVIVVWLAQNRKRFRELFALKRRWAIAIALFVTAATVSAIIAPDTFSALGIWKAYFIEPILFFYLIVDLLRSKQVNNDRLVSAILLGGVIVASVAIAQWLTGLGIPIPWDIQRRVTGVFDYPNALGLYLGPLAVLALSLRQGPALILSRPGLGLGFFVLFIVAILLAESEAAIAAIILTLIIMGLVTPVFRKKIILIVALLAIVSMVVPSSRSYLIQKITLQDYSGEVRRGQWSETWELIKDHPALGVGLSGYPEALKPYHTQTHIEIFQYPHNIFLNIWVELGLLGLVAFAFLCLQILLSLRGGQLSWPTKQSTEIASLATLARNDIVWVFPLLTMFLHGLVDVPYFKNDLAVLTWLFLALMYANTISNPKIQR